MQETTMDKVMEILTPPHLLKKIVKARICPGCSKTFQPRRQNQIYHNATCRQRGWANEHPRLAKKVAIRRREIKLTGLCPNNPIAVRAVADMIQAEARGLRATKSIRQCARPGCGRLVKRDDDHFCSRKHDLEDYIETLEARRQRARERYALKKNTAA
jgi:hypothetical protein